LLIYIAIFALPVRSCLVSLFFPHLRLNFEPLHSQPRVLSASATLLLAARDCVATWASSHLCTNFEPLHSQPRVLSASATLLLAARDCAAKWTSSHLCTNFETPRSTFACDISCSHLAQLRDALSVHLDGAHEWIWPNLSCCQLAQLAPKRFA